jgi:hypothetical protein
MDDRYWRNRHWVGFDIKRPPSYYWHSNMAATFMHDHSGIALRHAVGVNNMMWSTDNPHHGNDWPYARKIISEMMHTVDPVERHQMIAGNAARIYKLEGLTLSKNGKQAAGKRTPITVATTRRNGAARRPAKKAVARRR